MSRSLTGGDRSRRGMSSATAVVVLVITIVVLGAISFVVFNSSRAPTCAPANSPICTPSSTTHDVTVLAPFTTAQQGQLIPFTAILKSGETATQFKFTFGDGAIATSSTPTQDHAYAFPGTYLVYIQADVGGTWHDNLFGIQGISITSSHARDTLGTQPGIQGVLNSNSTSSSNPTGVLAPGGSITVTGRYTSNSSNPSYGVITPTLVGSAGASVGTVTTSTVGGFTQLQATVTFASAGVYTVTFVGGTKLPAGTLVFYQNFTWTAYVSSPSGSAIVIQPVNDPHPGKVIVYEYAPGGAGGEDPAVDYETVGYEPVVNVYEKLIDYNGTKAVDSPDGYIPVIATCVPGSSTCGTQFPTEPTGETNLVKGYNYTFVVGSTSTFYDPGSASCSAPAGCHWSVWPSDVLFSMARDIAMASDGEATPGWVQGQSLLPYCNPLTDATGCDGGLHAPYNSSPIQIFAHVLVNASAFCPAAAMTGTNHGCVTFVANGSGTTAGAKSWPFFLELMAAIGSGIVPASWFSAQGSVLAGWTDVAAYQGDHPDLLPGGATSSDQASFKTAVAAITDTGWDAMQGLLPSNLWGNVQYHMVGSGPYYLAGYTIGTSYTLKANPFYAQNPSCTTTYVGNTNFCYPASGTYAAEIDTTWEVDPTPGEAALASGVADFAGIPTTQTALLLELIQQGKAAAINFPGISIFFFAYTLDFGIAAAQTYPTGPITVKADWFDYIGMRNFFSTAFPYGTSQTTINTVGGIQYGFNYGGVIPQGMGNYYPTNISWPSSDPTNDPTNPASPAYWWTQMTTSGSPYYDPEAAACTTANPCQLPFFGETGAPNYDQALALEVQKVSQFSGGKVVVHTLDINFIQLVINSLFTGPGANPMPIFTLGWAPDYPDPTDYIGAMYYPNATYTFSDAYLLLSDQAVSPSSSSCTGFGDLAYSWTDLNYYVNNPVSQTCQGVAFNVMTLAEYHAAADTNLADRALIYNLGEHIAQKLALYIYFTQANTVYVYAPWVNGLSIDEHVTLGGGGDTMWFWINGNKLV
jgi:PKD domain-containing protein